MPQIQCQYDVVVDCIGIIKKVQVKATGKPDRTLNDKSRYCINISRVRHTGKVNEYANVPYKKGDFDFLAAYIAPKKLWYIIPFDALKIDSGVYHLYFFRARKRPGALRHTKALGIYLKGRRSLVQPKFYALTGVSSTFDRRYSTSAGRIYVNKETKKEYPSVTSVIDVLDKPFLAQWKLNEAVKYINAEYMRAREKGDEPLPGDIEAGAGFIEGITKKSKTASTQINERARNRGTDIHKFLELKLSGSDVTPLLQTETYLRPIDASVERWIARKNIEPVVVEATVFSDTWGFAGTADLVAKEEYKGEKQLVLIDFKSGKNTYRTHKLQLAAYSVAVEELTGYRPIISYVMHVNPYTGAMDEKLHMHSWEVTRNFEAFKHILEAYKWVYEEELNGN